MALPGIATFLQHQSPPRSATSSWGSTDSDASSSSPNIGAFKSIAITCASSSQQSFLASTSNSFRAFSSSSSSSSPGSSSVARTQMGYKQNADPTSSNRIGSSVPRRPVVRTSRYLREVDRRNILRRIEQGDKQADLAKEYQVSRAAISNLKQRRNRNLKDQQPMQLLTQRRTNLGINGGTQVTQHLSSPFPGDAGLSESYYHSESERSVSSQSSSSMKLMLSPMQLGHPVVEASSPKEYLSRVTQVNTTTVEVLFARILDQRTDARVFEMSKKRIARLLLEHALSIFQTIEIQIPVPSLSPRSSSTSPVSAAAAAASSYMGIEFCKPTSAVAVSSRREGGATASAAATAGVLLQEFRAIEPLNETGSVSFRASSIAGNDCMVQLPHSIHESNVLLLVDTLSSSSAQGVAMAIQAILRAGAQQNDICIVAICSHDRALAQVLEVFPHVRVVTAKVFAANGTAEAPHQLPTTSPAAQTQRGIWS